MSQARGGSNQISGAMLVTVVAHCSVRVPPWRSLNVIVSDDSSPSLLFSEAIYYLIAFVDDFEILKDFVLCSCHSILICYQISPLDAARCGHGGFK